MSEPNPTPPAPATGSVSGRLHPSANDRVGVLQASDESRLVALRRIAAGERLFQMEGETTERPTRYSLQLAEHLHLDAGADQPLETILLRYFWRFMNHSCEPSAVVEGRALVARRDIEPGEAVTFDYNTTEWSMAEPFACQCGSAHCLREIRGYKHLSAPQRARLRGVAPHLLRLAHAALPGAAQPA